MLQIGKYIKINYVRKIPLFIKSRKNFDLSNVCTFFKRKYTTRSVKFFGNMIKFSTRFYSANYDEKFLNTATVKNLTIINEKNRTENMRSINFSILPDFTG